MQKSLLKILSIIFYITLIGCSSSRADERVSFFQYNGKRGVINGKREIVIPPEYDFIRYNGSYYICEFLWSHENGRPNYTVFSKEKNILYQGNSHVVPVSKKYFQTGDCITNVRKNEENQDTKLKSFWEGNEDSSCYATNQGYYKEDFKTPAVVPKSDQIHYFRTYPFRNGRAVAGVYIIDKDEYDIQVIDSKSNIICSDIAACTKTYSEGLLAATMNDGTSGFLDESGKLVFKCPFFVHYQTAGGAYVPPTVNGHFNEGKAVVETAENQWAIYDKSGKKYDWPDGVQKANAAYASHVDGEEFKSGLLLVVKKENGTRKYGYIDHECKVAIPCIFEQAFDFMNDYAIVRLNGTDGVIDREGNFYSAESIVNGK